MWCKLNLATTTPTIMEQLAASSGLTAVVQSLLDMSFALFLAERRRLFRHLHYFILFFLHLFLRLTFVFVSPALSFLASLPPPRLLPAAAAAAARGGGGETAVARALVQVLALASRVPAASRKYDLIRSLAERLLDENLRYGPGILVAVNRAALAEAFARAVRLMEVAVEGERSVDFVAGVVRSGLRRLTAAGEGEEGGGLTTAEGLAAELMWLAEKMVVNGAEAEAVGLWGGAEKLGRLAVAAEPRVQVALIRLSVFLFKHTNKDTDEEEYDEKGCYMAQCQMSMLTSWLPLLCRVSNNVVAPILSNMERVGMVRLLENMIQKLNWEQQEVVLAVWLQHFSAGPDSDWPNLESSYTQWYAHSRKLLLN